MAKRTTTDAHESNAGDDFHVIWTIRKALQLLNFDEDGLKSIAVENLSPIDNQKFDEDGDILLGVDLTEYFGGIDFKSASKIVVSQLKYSTRHPNLEWTVAKICTPKKNKKGSIVERLATIYNEFVDKTKREEVLKKIQIKLVSNRPITATAVALVNKAKNILVKNPKGISIVDFKKIYLQKKLLK